MERGWKGTAPGGGRWKEAGRETRERREPRGMQALGAREESGEERSGAETK